LFLKRNLMKVPFFISEFKSDNFALNNLIKEGISADFQDVNQKRQLKHINSLLVQLDAKTIVCERDYIDGGYLDDFTKYYVTCHENYPKRCMRLHFFTKNFTYEVFEEEISSNVAPSNIGDYLGYMVIKPIPMTFIGRTCLKAPEQTLPINSKRISREYSVDLFGINLSVDSVAFQEQDQVVSACASASIWSLFHAMGIEKIPSPSQITLAATEPGKVINTFPNEGLSLEEIDRAIENFGFRKHSFSIKPELSHSLITFKRTVKAYLDSNIPILLGASLNLFSDVEDSYQCKGEHAVTIIGYGTDQNGDLNTVYVHDDRQGPFYTLILLSLEGITKIQDAEFGLSFPEDGSDNPKEILIPNNLIIATDKKMRINHRLIDITSLNLVDSLNAAYDKVKELKLKLNKDEAVDQCFTYSTKLYKSSEYKRELKANRQVLNKVDVLTFNLPRHIWVTAISFEGECVELVFDATSLPQGNAFICAAIYDKKSYDFISITALQLYPKLLNSENEFLHKRDKGFYLQVLRSLLQNTNTFIGYLDDKFGESRPPKEIKPEEFNSQLLNSQDDKLIFHNSFDNTPRLEGLISADEFRVIEGEKTHKKLIWIISQYGALFIGIDNTGTGHPTLTGANPARIGGEIKVYEGDEKHIRINCFSGRYTSNYSADKKKLYLSNAIEKFKDIFREVEINISMDDGIDFTR
jgi:hypothetical protein